MVDFEIAGWYITGHRFFILNFCAYLEKQKQKNIIKTWLNTKKQHFNSLKSHDIKGGKISKEILICFHLHKTNKVVSKDFLLHKQKSWETDIFSIPFEILPPLKTTFTTLMKAKWLNALDKICNLQWLFPFEILPRATYN